MVSSASKLPRASINQADDDWSTALHDTAKSGSSGMVKLLLEAGADVSICNKESSTPLHQVMCRWSSNEDAEERLHKAELLLRAGADVNARDSGGKTPAHLCDVKHKAVLRLLVQTGADVSVQQHILRE